MTKDANQKKAALENKPNPKDVLIAEELQKWQALQMTPLGVLPQLMGQVPGIPVDVYKMDTMIVSLFQSIVEQLGLDEDRANEKFRDNYLSKLREIREANEEEVKQMRQRQQIMVPGAEIPQLIIPENIRRKMH